jgi:hypothetical protein
MTIIFIIKERIIIHKLDLHQENGQKGTATIIKEQNWLRRKQEKIGITSITPKVFNAKLGKKETGEYWNLNKLKVFNTRLDFQICWKAV